MVNEHGPRLDRGAKTGLDAERGLGKPGPGVLLWGC